MGDNGRGEVQKTSDLGKSLALWGLGADTVQAGSADHWAVDLFGDLILTKSGKKATSEVVADKKKVLVYFSAHWCPPCRGFTPLLKGAYDSDLKDANVEIVFVSSDQDEDGAFSYFTNDHGDWLLAPHGCEAGKQLNTL